MNVITLHVANNVYNTLRAKYRCLINNDLNMTDKAAHNKHLVLKKSTFVGGGVSSLFFICLFVVFVSVPTTLLNILYIFPIKH